jgi:hypothetical protein
MSASCNIAFFRQIVNKFFARFRFFSVHTEFQLTLLRHQDHRLAAQLAHHVEGTLRFAFQRQLQNIILDALLDSLLQLRGHLKVPIGRA